jgi:endonuclease III
VKALAWRGMPPAKKPTPSIAKSSTAPKAVAPAKKLKAVATKPAKAVTSAKPKTAKARALLVHERLAELYPQAQCELDHGNAFELLVATILSAQCTDARVNIVTPALFAKYPTPVALAAADRDELEEMIRSTGFFHNKATSLLGMSAALIAKHAGEVPGDMDDLVALPGVGRKTANVVRSVALGLPGLPVDTHVGRLARKLGLTVEEDPVRVELELNPMVPDTERGQFSLRIILHGRRVCGARKPLCGECVLADFCPSAGK